MSKLTSPTEGAETVLKQAETAGMPIALVQTEHLRALLAALAVARIGLTRLSRNDEMAGMGQRDDDPEAVARCQYAQRTLAAMEAHATQEVPR